VHGRGRLMFDNVINNDAIDKLTDEQLVELMIILDKVK
jgi:hypothetical protein